MGLGAKALCYFMLSIVLFMIGGAAGVIMICAWFAYEVYCEAKLWQRHEQYIKEKREANKKKGYIYID